VYPKILTDLFHGSELVVVGRYRDAGKHNVVLNGKRAGESMTWSFPATFTESATEHDFLPRLWATRKIGYLMDEIRLHGEKSELKDEIVRLAKRHAIITPYTSYLVVEDAELQVAQGRAPTGATPLAPMLRSHAEHNRRFAVEMQSRGAYGRAAGGRPAVEASKEALALKAAPADRFAAPAAPGQLADTDGDGLVDLGVGGAGEQGGGQQRQIQQVGGNTFYLDSNGRWVDSEYDGKAETKKVTAFSDDYFAMVKKTSDLGKYLALGQRLIVVLNKVAYEIESAP
jgi:Ca-activated chloride channel homolog